ncbi:helix-turn-helix domain-containing protein [Canibacter oris]|uniref:Excisionase family DNA binding protein n=1 Tax=Canibacter oris TaxID=1365628 RepID=A0A840DJ29_9MICO|nr:helix-turn-helix domain-containing protein [Canibacter oris]MBB4071723.1 excisionase family DNA binding protein [Canibacter oris]
MKTNTVKPLAYGIMQAAEMLSVSPKTLRKLIYAGKLHAVKIGSRYVIKASEIERLANEGAGC